MKLIIMSIICGVLGLILGEFILNIGGHAGDFGIILFGVIGFFSPGLYTIEKIYENTQKEYVDK